MAEFSDLSFKFFSSEEYRQMGEEVLAAIGLGWIRQKIIVTDETIDLFRDAYRSYYLPFMERHPHIMERYLVHGVFGSWFKGNKPIFEQYTRLLMLYSSLRFMLVCLAASRHRLDEAMIINLITKTTRHLVNGKIVIEIKLRRLNETGRMNMDHLGQLIKMEQL
jgi:hypothetical protein